MDETDAWTAFLQTGSVLDYLTYTTIKNEGKQPAPASRRRPRMRISTDGLILREQNIGEQNRLVTVLTRSHGVVRAFVRNCRSLKSPKGAATRLLCYSRLVIFAGRDTYTIDEAQSEEMFIPLRNDVVNMSLAQYFCELALHFVPENLPAGDYLRLLLNALYLLSRGKRPRGLSRRRSSCVC